jgi:gamma-glutamyltranspeptidase/glutathione hydrolase
MRLGTVLEAAIGYASQGYPLVERISATIASVADVFREHWPSSAAIYLPRGNVPPPGSLFRNQAIADCYVRLLREAESGGGGRDAEIERARQVWSQGFIAESVDRFCRSEPILDVSGRRHRGILTGDDMSKWRASVEPPLAYDYGRFTVLKPGPWSQGLVALQQLALLQGFDLEGIDPTSSEFIHLQVECAKLAFADRDSFYGDPAFVEVPVKTLLSDTYNERRRQLIGDTASIELRPGTMEGFGTSPVAPKTASNTRWEPGSGEPTVARLGESFGDTVHFDIIDQRGNMISATPSGGWLQSSPIIPDLGFCLGTRAQMFWLDEHHPCAIAPYKRPRSTLSPTLALRDGDPYLIWGSPGGDQQDQWIVQMFLRHVHARYDLQEAIDAPAWHSEHFASSFWPRESRPGVLVLEGSIGETAAMELRARGHIVERGPNWSEGRLTAAAREGSLLKAAANPRGMQGYAVGR